MRVLHMSTMNCIYCSSTCIHTYIHHILNKSVDSFISSVGIRFFHVLWGFCGKRGERARGTTNTTYYLTLPTYHIYSRNILYIVGKSPPPFPLHSPPTFLPYEYEGGNNLLV